MNLWTWTIIIEQRDRWPISQMFATGSGALVDKTNLAVMEQGGLVICLYCQPDVLWQRVGHSEDRPVLAERDNGRFARLATLLEACTPTYQRIEHHIDVTQLFPQQVAERVGQTISDNN